MRNFGKRLGVVTGLLASGAIFAAVVVACSDDTEVITPPPATRDGGPDSSSPPPPPPPQDAGSDATVVIPVEAGSLAEFITENGRAACVRAKECCLAGGHPTFREEDCVTDLGEHGWNQSLRQITAPGVADGGKVSFDAVAASECLTAIRNMTCTNATAAEYKAAVQKCYQAAQGTGVATSACINSVECAPPNFCDPDNNGGTCTPVHANGENCTLRVAPHEECSYRGVGNAGCFEPSGGGQRTCGALLADGQDCTYDFDCQSGACARQDDAGTVYQCSSTMSFIDGICEYYE